MERVHVIGFKMLEEHIVEFEWTTADSEHNTSSVYVAATGGWVLPSVLLIEGMLSGSSRPRSPPANASNAVLAGKEAEGESTCLVSMRLVILKRKKKLICSRAICKRSKSDKKKKIALLNIRKGR